MRDISSRRYNKYLSTLGTLLVGLPNQTKLVQRLSIALAQHWPWSRPGQYIVTAMIRVALLLFLLLLLLLLLFLLLLLMVDDGWPAAVPALPNWFGVPRVPVDGKLQLVPHLQKQRLLRTQYLQQYPPISKISINIFNRFDSWGHKMYFHRASQLVESATVKLMVFFETQMFFK